MAIKDLRIIKALDIQAQRKSALHNCLIFGRTYGLGLWDNVNMLGRSPILPAAIGNHNEIERNSPCL
ncbi:MAG: hypothetical protein CO189_02755 [candidate division Zixibacteria bacterium CG_4_9_14_3_um_filter_46_8]|nr:MAG: hypothetical protein CO189_02755 [candidate division Zixibacteria bacterium CG_4_9_14_3_um_filter_46_8]